MKRALGFTALAVFALAVAMPAQAQTKKQVQGYIAGGYTLLEADAGDYYNNGWDISGGAIFRPAPDRPFALRFDLGYNYFDADSGLIDAAQQFAPFVNDGRASLGTLTAEIMYEFGGSATVGGYIAFGLGGIHRYANVTTTVGNNYYYCDPWWGYCYYGTGESVVKSSSLTKMDYTVGAGMTFNVGEGQLYLEARYHWMYGAEPSTQMAPILIGYRF